MKLSSTNNPIPVLLGLIFSVIYPGLCFGQYSPADNQTRTTRSEQIEMVNRITACYNQWQTLELNGSLQTDRLPINPSVRIFMERNRLIQISVRAPLVGEAVRIDMTPDSIIAINKLKHTYFAETLADALQDMPVTCGAAQNLLLGRIFLPDGEMLSGNNHTSVNVSHEEDCWLVVPLIQPLNGNVQYGFMVDDAGVLGATYFTTRDGLHTALCEYVEKKGNTLMDLTVESDRKVFFASLKLNSPKWGTSAMKPAQIKGSYRRVYSIGEFIKSF